MIKSSIFSSLCIVISVSLFASTLHAQETKEKMKFKPHVAEGYVAKRSKIFKGQILLHPRVTMATGEDGHPLKCSLFVATKFDRNWKAPLPGRNAVALTDKYFNAIEQLSDWRDYKDFEDENYPRQLVRLEGVHRFTGRVDANKDIYGEVKNACSFEELVRITDTGSDIPTEPSNLKFTPLPYDDDQVYDNPLIASVFLTYPITWGGTPYIEKNEVNFRYATCLQSGANSVRNRIRTVDYCRCDINYYQKHLTTEILKEILPPKYVSKGSGNSKAERYNEAARNQIKTPLIRKGRELCENPETYR